VRKQFYGRSHDATEQDLRLTPVTFTSACECPTTRARRALHFPQSRDAIGSINQKYMKKLILLVTTMLLVLPSFAQKGETYA